MAVERGPRVFRSLNDLTSRGFNGNLDRSERTPTIIGAKRMVGLPRLVQTHPRVNFVEYAPLTLDRPQRPSLYEPCRDSVQLVPSRQPPMGRNQFVEKRCHPSPVTPASRSTAPTRRVRSNGDARRIPTTMAAPKVRIVTLKLTNCSAIPAPTTGSDMPM